MKIGSWNSADSCLLVAEIGNNHEGDAVRAHALVRAAAAAGARAVKFQTLRADGIVGPQDPARVARLKGFELSAETYRSLAALSRELGLLFLSTPLDLEAVDLLRPLVDAYKVASGDITFRPLLRRIAKSGLPVIVSTGASTIEEVDEAVACLHAFDPAIAERLALLHCVSAYPAPPEELNLALLATLRARYPALTIGYSDHALGSEGVLAAAALGARIIEKHFTLDHDLSDFRDHKLSADPTELRDLLARLPEAASGRLPLAPGPMLGDGRKRVMPCEAATRVAIRRSICAARDLDAGTVLAREDLTWLRPEGGLAPGQEDRVIGRRLARAVTRGLPIPADGLEPA